MRRGLDSYDPRAYDDADNAEQALDDILGGIIQKYVKTAKQKKPGPVIWWNDACQTAYIHKQKLFLQQDGDVNVEKRIRYNAASAHSRIVQRRAFDRYQFELAEKLSSLEKSDKKFWQLTKEIGGIDSARSTAAPSAEKLAVAFASKMSNGKEEENFNFTFRDERSVPIHSWRIRLKTVEKVLSNIDSAKSANGVSPIF